MRPNERTAIHEAGHAVAAFAQHRRLGRVTIIPEGDSLGSCGSGSLGHFRPDIDVDRATQAKVDREVIICLAGGEAEKLITGRYPGAWATLRDVTTAFDLAGRVMGDMEGVNVYMLWMKYQTKALLREPWHRAAIEALAAALLERRELGPQQVRRIIRTAIDQEGRRAH